MPRFQFSRFILRGLVAVSIVLALFAVTTLVVVAALPRGPQISFIRYQDGYDLMMIDVRSGVTVTLTEGGIVNNSVIAAWSPDGAWMAYNELDAQGIYQPVLLLTNVGGAFADYVEDTPTAANPNTITTNVPLTGFISWSPDSRFIAFVGLQDGMWQLFVVDMLTGVSEAVEGVRDAWRPAWSPDGRWIAYRTQTLPRDVHIYDRETGQRRVLLDMQSDNAARRTGELAFTGSPTALEQWSPDGKTLAVPVTYRLRDGRGEGLLLIDPATGEREMTILLPDFEQITTAFWSPDGASIGYTVSDSTTFNPSIVVIDAQTGDEQHRIPGILRDWSSDGLLIERNEEGDLTWYVMASPDGKARRLAVGPGSFRRLVWRP